MSQLLCTLVAPDHSSLSPIDLKSSVRLTTLTQTSEGVTHFAADGKETLNCPRTGLYSIAGNNEAGPFPWSIIATTFG